MLSWKSETYIINFFNPQDSEWNGVNVKFDNCYSSGNEYVHNSKLGIQVIFPKANHKNYLTVLESAGGGTGVHLNCSTRINDLIIACCGDHIFAIELDSGKLKWQAQADTATCFGIFTFENKICVHGELQISMFDIDGKKLWSQGGRDIFTTPEGKNDFKIENGKIYATDCPPPATARLYRVRKQHYFIIFIL